MKHGFGWVAVAGLVLVVGACGKGATPTAEVAIETATRISSPAPTATLSSTPLPPTPSVTARPPGYPAGVTVTPVSYPSSTLAGGYPAGASQYNPPTATPTAVVEWFVPATETNGSIPIEFHTPPPPQPFMVACEKFGWYLLRLSDSSTVSNFVPPPTTGCPAWVGWSPDGQSAAIVANNRELYLWRTDGTPPKSIGLSLGADEYSHPSWSPNGWAFAYIITDTLFTQPHLAPVAVISALGERVIEFETEGGSEGENIFWLADNVLCRSDRTRVPCYQASSGKLLFRLQGWHILTSGCCPAQQLPSFSSDQTKVILDESYYRREANDFRDHQAIYKLFDLIKLNETLLPDTGYNPLAFVGWSEDGRKAYLIHSPLTLEATPASQVPFGLLVFDTRTGRYDVLFEEAVFVTWAPSQKWAMVVFPSRTATDELGLSVGVWQVGTKVLIGRIPFSNKLIINHAGWDAYLGRLSFGAPVWSPDGQWVVFGDALGKLNLIGIDGTVKQLAADASGALWLDVKLHWSPDDARLLVQHGNRAWVVALP